MEAKSVEDKGAGVLFCVYCYNVQPGVSIDYATGNSALDGSSAQAAATPAPTQAPVTTEAPAVTAAPQVQGSTYVLNTNTHKFHYPDCSSVKQMADHNRQDYTGTRDEVIAMGYDPCGRCNP